MALNRAPFLFDKLCCSVNMRYQKKNMKYILILSLSLFIPFLSVFASVGNWSNDPFVLRDFVNSKAGQVVPSSGALNFDSATALKICQLAGFDAVESYSCSSSNYQGRCGYTSCKDNNLAKWNSSKNKFDVFNACSAGNTWIASLKCKKSCISSITNKCVGNSVYWFDSCTNKQGLVANCTGNQTCQNGQCVNSCTPNASQKCVGNSVYWFDSCGSQQGLIYSCIGGQTCQNGQCVNNCFSHSYQKCVGNAIYWFNSCGAQDGFVQYCSYGCSGGSCINNYYNYNNYNNCNNYNCNYSYNNNNCYQYNCGYNNYNYTGYSYSGCENSYSCDNVWNNNSYYPYYNNYNYNNGYWYYPYYTY